MTGPAGSGYAGRCETCDDAPKWSIMRHGDTVLSWACSEHLDQILERLQRDHEVTELSIWSAAKREGWADPSRILADQNTLRGEFGA